MYKSTAIKVGIRAQLDPHCHKVSWGSGPEEPHRIATTGHIYLSVVSDYFK